MELHFRVVGVLEQLNCTLRVAEQRIGTFFGGVQQLYFKELLGKANKGRKKCTFFKKEKNTYVFLEPRKNKNHGRPKQLREDLQMALRKNLTMEYMFYSFVKQRLLEQCGENQTKN